MITHSHIKIGSRAFSSSASTLRGAIDKRIPVQLLRDFEGLGVKGEIVQVAPGRMRNQLHRNNGAAYILKNLPPRIKVISRESILEKQRLEREEREAKEREELEKKAITEASERSRRHVAQADMMAALGNLTNLNFDVASASNASASASASTVEGNPGELSESEAYFVESALNDAPGVTIVTVNNQTSGILSSPFTAADISEQYQKLMGVDIPASSIKIVTRQGDLDFVDFIGKYPVKITMNQDRVIKKTLSLVPKFKFEGWESATRPKDVPLPKVNSEKQAKNSESSEVENSQEKNTQDKKFEWENEIIDKF